MGSRFRWFSSSSGCPRQTAGTTTTVVRKVTSNGQTHVTTYQTSTQQNQPQLLTINTNSCPNQNSTSQNIQPLASKSEANQGSALAPITASEFEKECLDEHNRLRALHGCPPLKLNRRLCEFSTEWANYLASRNTLQHRSNLQYGENIYQSGGMQVNGKTAVEAWYSEIKNYGFGHGGFSSNTGHFTQVVWKNSKELGVGCARRGNSVWVVANYDPPGNYGNQYLENVPRKK